MNANVDVFFFNVPVTLRRIRLTYVKSVVRNINEIYRIAADVKISDMFPEEAFEIVSGSLSKTIETLSPGSSSTHTVSVKPIIGGAIVMIPAANVEYSWMEHDEETDSDEVMTVETKSSNIGSVKILTKEVYAERNSQHMKEWSVWFTFSGLSIFVPYYVWASKGSAYHSSGKKKIL